MSENPYVEIVVQPQAYGLRFRYQCEGRSAGNIPGELRDVKTFPKIKIHNTQGMDVVIVVSLVTRDEPPRCMPHPHKLVGTDCNDGVCTTKLRKGANECEIKVGIQCVRRRDIRDSLQKRQDLRVDPFQTGCPTEEQAIDLSACRLSFQAFLPGNDGRFTRIVPPVASNVIFDRKTVNDLVICRISRSAGCVTGGDEVFLLCDKVSKDDILVCFSETDPTTGQVMWEGRGEFTASDVHRQYAIAFKTPPYKNHNITEPVEVDMYLQRPSDHQRSDLLLKWSYTPVDNDPHQLGRKKRKIMDFMCDQGPSALRQVDQAELMRRMQNKPNDVLDQFSFGATNDPTWNDPPMTEEKPLSGDGDNIMNEALRHSGISLTGDILADLCFDQMEHVAKLEDFVTLESAEDVSAIHQFLQQDATNQQPQS